MFGKKTIENTTSTVIGEGIQLNAALLSGVGSVRIDGNYQGDIEIDGTLILGENGRIEGNVSAKTAFMAGAMEGNIYCSSNIHLASSAVFNGNIEAPEIVIDGGAIFNGSCQMAERPIEFSKHKKSDRGEKEYASATNL